VPKKPNQLTILHQNIASILSKQELFECTLMELRNKNIDPDILCLSETFLKTGHDIYLKLYNYKLASTYCREKQRGGTCILAKNGLQWKELSFLKTYAKQKAFELCGIEMLSDIAKKLIIICLYRTPSSDPNIFLQLLNNLLFDISKKYKSKTHIVITGDFNINTLKKGKITTEFQNLCQNYDLKIHVDIPTRRHACIDHILSNISEATVDVLPLYLSDHDTAQLLTLPVEQKVIKPHIYYIYKRDYSIDNVRKFKDCLQSMTWKNIYQETELDKAFHLFHDLVCLFHKLCFPKIRIKINDAGNNRQNWITRGLKKSCKTKRYLRYKYYKKNNEYNKNRYVKYSKILKNLIYISKKNANMKFINNNRNKCKATWTIIKREISNTDIKDHIEHIRTDNTIVTDTIKIAEIFNNHYIDSTLHETVNNSKPYKNTTVNSMFLKPMTEKEVIMEIIGLNNTNAVGHDEINTKIVKACTDELVPILTHLINLSFSTGSFPQALKLSIVKPLYKKGSKEDVNNYRPITLIPILSKVFEKCMLKRIINFCDKFEIIKKEQYGFQKGKSTTLAIFSLLKVIVTNINKNNFTTGLFFDLSKAFDFVSHKLLLGKLENLGIRGAVLQWLSSYLSNRQQCVSLSKIDKNSNVISYSSAYKHNGHGIPQGSVMGPILFLLYINDITDITNHNCILFADDISIIVTSEKNLNTIKDHEDDINNTIDNITVWLETNNLKINLNKSKCIQFNQCNNPNNNHKLNSVKIEQVSQTKFLGVIIDQNLNWKAHIDHITTRINKFVYALKQIKNITNAKTAIISYHAYVQSILRYGLVMYGNGTDRDRAFVAQKKCIRAICGIRPDESCKQFFKKLNLLPLPCLYIYEMCLFVRKHIHLFKKASDMYPRNTRNPDRLVLEDIPRLAKYTKSSLCMAVKIFNKIPNDLKTLRIGLFKTKLFDWLNMCGFYDLQGFEI
jgi:hypothetical protein